MGRTLRVTGVLAAAALAAVGGGCNATGLMMLTQKDGGRIQPDCPLQAKGESKTVTVAILSSADPGVPVDFAGVDRELAVLLGKKLAAGSQDAKKPVRPITVVEQSKVDRYLAGHPAWQANSPGAIGKPLGADYVIDMRVNQISMYDPNFGREAYVGQATVQVAVYDAADPDRPMRDLPHTSHQPAKDTNAPASHYRQEFVNTLADELSWKYVPHLPERRLGPIK